MSTALLKLALLVGVDKRELDDTLVACRLILGPEFEHWDQAGLAVLAIWCGRQIVGMRKAAFASAIGGELDHRAKKGPTGASGPPAPTGVPEAMVHVAETMVQAAERAVQQKFADAWREREEGPECVIDDPVRIAEKP